MYDSKGNYIPDTNVDGSAAPEPFLLQADAGVPTQVIPVEAPHVEYVPLPPQPMPAPEPAPAPVYNGKNSYQPLPDPVAAPVYTPDPTPAPAPAQAANNSGYQAVVVQAGHTAVPVDVPYQDPTAVYSGKGGSAPVYSPPPADIQPQPIYQPPPQQAQPQVEPPPAAAPVDNQPQVMPAGGFDPAHVPLFDFSNYTDNKGASHVVASLKDLHTIENHDPLSGTFGDMVNQLKNIETQVIFHDPMTNAAYYAVRSVDAASDPRSPTQIDNFAAVSPADHNVLLSQLTQSPSDFPTLRHYVLEHTPGGYTVYDGKNHQTTDATTGNQVFTSSVGTAPLADAVQNYSDVLRNTVTNPHGYFDEELHRIAYRMGYDGNQDFKNPEIQQFIQPAVKYIGLEEVQRIVQDAYQHGAKDKADDSSFFGLGKEFGIIASIALAWTGVGEIIGGAIASSFGVTATAEAVAAGTATVTATESAIITGSNIVGNALVNTALNGGDLVKGFEGAVIGSASASVGQMAGDFVNANLPGTDLAFAAADSGISVADIAKGTATAARITTSTVLNGGDVGTALETGALSGVVGGVVGNNFSDGGGTGPNVAAGITNVIVQGVMGDLTAVSAFNGFAPIPNRAPAQTNFDDQGNLQPGAPPEVTATYNNAIASGMSPMDAAATAVGLPPDGSSPTPAPESGSVDLSQANLSMPAAAVARDYANFYQTFVSENGNSTLNVSNDKANQMLPLAPPQSPLADLLQSRLNNSDSTLSFSVDQQTGILAASYSVGGGTDDYTFDSKGQVLTLNSTMPVDSLPVAAGQAQSTLGHATGMSPMLNTDVPSTNVSTPIQTTMPLESNRGVASSGIQMTMPLESSPVQINPQADGTMPFESNPGGPTPISNNESSVGMNMQMPLQSDVGATPVVAQPSDSALQPAVQAVVNPETVLATGAGAADVATMGGSPDLSGTGSPQQVDNQASPNLRVLEGGSDSVYGSLGGAISFTTPGLPGAPAAGVSAPVKDFMSQTATGQQALNDAKSEYSSEIASARAAAATHIGEMQSQQTSQTNLRETVLTTLGDTEAKLQSFVDHPELFGATTGQISAVTNLIATSTAQSASLGEANQSLIAKSDELNSAITKTNDQISGLTSDATETERQALNTQLQNLVSEQANVAAASRVVAALDANRDGSGKVNAAYAGGSAARESAVQSEVALYTSNVAAALSHFNENVSSAVTTEYNSRVEAAAAQQAYQTAQQQQVGSGTTDGHSAAMTPAQAAGAKYVAAMNDYNHLVSVLPLGADDPGAKAAMDLLVRPALGNYLNLSTLETTAANSRPAVMSASDTAKLNAPSAASQIGNTLSNMGTALSDNVSNFADRVSQVGLVAAAQEVAANRGNELVTGAGLAKNDVVNAVKFVGGAAGYGSETNVRDAQQTMMDAGAAVKGFVVGGGNAYLNAQDAINAADRNPMGTFVDPARVGQYITRPLMDSIRASGEANDARIRNITQNEGLLAGATEAASTMLHGAAELSGAPLVIKGLETLQQPDISMQQAGAGLRDTLLGAAGVVPLIRGAGELVAGAVRAGEVAAVADSAGAAARAGAEAPALSAPTSLPSGVLARDGSSTVLEGDFIRVAPEVAPARPAIGFDPVPPSPVMPTELPISTPEIPKFQPATVTPAEPIAGVSTPQITHDAVIIPSELLPADLQIVPSLETGIAAEAAVPAVRMGDVAKQSSMDAVQASTNVTMDDIAARYTKIVDNLRSQNVNVQELTRSEIGKITGDSSTSAVFFIDDAGQANVLISKSSTAADKYESLLHEVTHKTDYLNPEKSMGSSLIEISSESGNLSVPNYSNFVSASEAKSHTVQFAAEKQVVGAYLNEANLDAASAVAGRMKETIEVRAGVFTELGESLSGVEQTLASGSTDLITIKAGDVAGTQRYNVAVTDAAGHAKEVSFALPEGLTQEQAVQGIQSVIAQGRADIVSGEARLAKDIDYYNAVKTEIQNLKVESQAATSSSSVGFSQTADGALPSAGSVSTPSTAPDLHLVPPAEIAPPVAVDMGAAPVVEASASKALPIVQQQIERDIAAISPSVLEIDASNTISHLADQGVSVTFVPRDSALLSGADSQLIKQSGAQQIVIAEDLSSSARLTETLSQSEALRAEAALSDAGRFDSAAVQNAVTDSAADFLVQRNIAASYFSNGDLQQVGSVLKDMQASIDNRAATLTQVHQSLDAASVAVKDSSNLTAMEVLGNGNQKYVLQTVSSAGEAQGVEYVLQAGLTPEQALARIESRIQGATDLNSYAESRIVKDQAIVDGYQAKLQASSTQASQSLAPAAEAPLVNAPSGTSPVIGDVNTGMVGQWSVVPGASTDTSGFIGSRTSGESVLGTDVMNALGFGKTADGVYLRPNDTLINSSIERLNLSLPSDQQIAIRYYSPEGSPLVPNDEFVNRFLNHNEIPMAPVSDEALHDASTHTIAPFVFPPELITGFQDRIGAVKNFLTTLESKAPAVLEQQIPDNLFSQFYFPQAKAPLADVRTAVMDDLTGRIDGFVGFSQNVTSASAESLIKTEVADGVSRELEKSSVVDFVQNYFKRVDLGPEGAAALKDYIETLSANPQNLIVPDVQALTNEALARVDLLKSAVDTPRIVPPHIEPHVASPSMIQSSEVAMPAAPSLAPQAPSSSASSAGFFAPTEASSPLTLLGNTRAVDMASGFEANNLAVAQDAVRNLSTAAAPTAEGARSTAVDYLQATDAYLTKSVDNGLMSAQTANETRQAATATVQQISDQFLPAGDSTVASLLERFNAPVATDAVPATLVPEAGRVSIDSGGFHLAENSGKASASASDIDSVVSQISGVASEVVSDERIAKIANYLQNQSADSVRAQALQFAESVTNRASSLGVPVEVGTLDPEIYGQFQPEFGNVVINSNVSSDVQLAATINHEVGHAVTAMGEGQAGNARSIYWQPLEGQVDNSVSVLGAKMSDYAKGYLVDEIPRHMDSIAILFRGVKEGVASQNLGLATSTLNEIDSNVARTQLFIDQQNKALFQASQFIENNSQALTVVKAGEASWVKVPVNTYGIASEIQIPLAAGTFASEAPAALQAVIQAGQNDLLRMAKGLEAQSTLAHEMRAALPMAMESKVAPAAPAPMKMAMPEVTATPDTSVMAAAEPRTAATATIEKAPGEITPLSNDQPVQEKPVTPPAHSDPVAQAAPAPHAPMTNIPESHFQAPPVPEFIQSAPAPVKAAYQVFETHSAEAFQAQKDLHAKEDSFHSLAKKENRDLTSGEKSELETQKQVVQFTKVREQVSAQHIEHMTGRRIEPSSSFAFNGSDVLSQRQRAADLAKEEQLKHQPVEKSAAAPQHHSNPHVAPIQTVTPVEPLVTKPVSSSTPPATPRMMASVQETEIQASAPVTEGFVGGLLHKLSDGIDSVGQFFGWKNKK